MLSVSTRQLMCLRFIAGVIESNGCPPTMREIGSYMDIGSTNGVNDHLKALERKGMIRRDSMKSRAIRLTDAGKRAVIDKSIPDEPPPRRRQAAHRQGRDGHPMRQVWRIYFRARPSLPALPRPETRGRGDAGADQEGGLAHV